MRSNLLPLDDINYSALYGKLFAALLNQFGTNYISEIEDAIQNTFLKSLKIWKHSNIPQNKDNWLFIVARNDLLNQIKRRKEYNKYNSLPVEETSCASTETDLRLQTIIFISTVENISNQAKVFFILKNIFGATVDEIRDSTLSQQEAIYKSIKRTKKNIQNTYKDKEIDLTCIPGALKTLPLVEEIMYAVFNIGFDTFRKKMENTVNEEICLEAFALTRLLYMQYRADTTRNLLALLCFHSARIPAKIECGKLIPFFKQNREKWNKELITLGFAFLKKPNELNKFYLEAIITSKYMTIPDFKQNDWLAIVQLYKMMQQVSQSPLIKLNYCFCLSKVGKRNEALMVLAQIEKELPKEHLYFALVKADILKKINPQESNDLYLSVMHNMNQQIRKQYLLDNGLSR